jgi:hypothetical protein
MLIELQGAVVIFGTRYFVFSKIQKSNYWHFLVRKFVESECIQ